jgi:YidC/Oxa1 family membrane protein insertase
MLSIFGVPVDAAYSLVSGFTGILTPVLGGLAAVAVIIAFTMAVRVLLMPLSLRALRGQAAQARLAPQLQALRQRYARQPERLQQEMSALFKREGTSVFAGFGPILIQWPFLSVMYLLFRSPHVGGKTNTLLTHDLLGVPLGTHWLTGPGVLSAQGAVFLGVFALLAALCWLSSRLARRWTPSPAPALAPAPTKAIPSKAPVRVKSAPAKAGSAPAKAASAPAKAASAPAKAAPATAKAALATTTKAAPAQAPPVAPPQVPGGALVKALPYFTVVIAAFAPLAAGIYLITSTAWSLAERFIWRSRASAASRSPQT